MAISQQGFFGNFSGRFGNLLVYQVKGKTIVRTAPTTRKDNGTAALKQVRNDFSRVMKIMQAVKPFIRMGFNDVAGNGSAFHSALSANLLVYRQAAMPDDFKWLMLSRGERAGAVGLVLSKEDDYARVSWNGVEAQKIFSPNDWALLLAINTTTLNTTVSIQEAKRNQQWARLKLPEANQDERVQVFIAFQDPNGWIRKNEKNTSNSQWAGEC